MATWKRIKIMHSVPQTVNMPWRPRVVQVCLMCDGVCSFLRRAALRQTSRRSLGCGRAGRPSIRWFWELILSVVHVNCDSEYVRMLLFLRSTGRFCSRSSWRTIASEETWSRRASRRSSVTPSPKQMWTGCSRWRYYISFRELSCYKFFFNCKYLVYLVFVVILKTGV